MGGNHFENPEQGEKTMKRLGVREQRAAKMCAWIKEAGQARIGMEWVKSRTWGANPRIEWRGAPCTDISGCGYDKESACLAQALRWMGESEEEKRAIHATGGAGFQSVVNALDKVGWALTRTGTGKWFDGFEIRRKG
jgi:hypothetical protein